MVFAISFHESIYNYTPELMKNFSVLHKIRNLNSSVSTEGDFTSLSFADLIIAGIMLPSGIGGVVGKRRHVCPSILTLQKLLILEQPFQITIWSRSSSSRRSSI